MKISLALISALASAAAVLPAHAQPSDDPDAAVVADSEVEQVGYKLKGKKALYPDEMADDGERTYIFWASDRELPAVFALDEQKQEILVDGYMRGEHYTIDRVYGQLVFRLGKDVAIATRLKGSVRR